MGHSEGKAVCGPIRRQSCLWAKQTAQKSSGVMAAIASVARFKLAPSYFFKLAPSYFFKLAPSYFFKLAPSYFFKLAPSYFCHLKFCRQCSRAMKASSKAQTDLLVLYTYIWNILFCQPDQQTPEALLRVMSGPLCFMSSGSLWFSTSGGDGWCVASQRGDSTLRHASSSEHTFVPRTSSKLLSGFTC